MRLQERRDAMILRFRKPRPLNRVFISHSSRDKPIARRLFRRLRMLGADVFLDENDLGIGDKLSSQLKRNIETSGFCLVIWTGNARASDWVMKEIAFAVRSRVAIVPLLFTDPVGHDAIRDAIGVDFRLGDGFEENFAKISTRLGLTAAFEPSGFEAEIAELTSRYGWAKRFMNLEEAFHLIQTPGKPDLAIFDYLPGTPDERFELDTLCYALAKTAPRINLIAVYSAIFGYLVAKHGIAFEAARSIIDDCNERRDEGPGLTDLSAWHKVFDLLVDVPFDESLHLDMLIALAARDPARAAGWARYLARSTLPGDLPPARLRAMLELAGDTATNGWPVDLLIALGKHAPLAEAASAKLISFMLAGQFDGYKDHRVTESPTLFLLAIQAFADHGHTAIAETMATKAARRIRDGMLNPPSLSDRNDRSGTQFCLSVWWIYNAVNMAPTKSGHGMIWAQRLETALMDSDQYAELYEAWKPPLKSVLEQLHTVLRMRMRDRLVLGPRGWSGLRARELNTRTKEVFSQFGFQRNLD